MKNYSRLDSMIQHLRKDYSYGKLEDKAAAKNPRVQFAKWFEAALKAKVISPNAVTLATCGKKKTPSARVVLVKGFDAKGFVFYTGYESHKAQEIRSNPWAEMVFFWPALEQQIRVSGKLSKIPAAQSDAYFNSRPRAAQLGAWACAQSRTITDRKALDAQYEKSVRKFEGKPVPRPSSWGGYRLSPFRYEFWQGRANRLNDRILYEKKSAGWKRQRLQP